MNNSTGVSTLYLELFIARCLQTRWQMFRFLIGKQTYKVTSFMFAFHKQK